MKESRQKYLEPFGFTFERGGAHIARTMMLEDLDTLLAFVGDGEASKTAYWEAITEENCLGKRSGRTRALSYRHLASLYALDPEVTLFRVLHFFWQRDPEGRPLLALLCAYARDAVLRLSAPFVLNLSRGAVISREDAEKYIESREPGRFSRATLRSTAQNVNGTWTLSGHFSGHIRKTRSQARATAGAVSYALFLGYLTGIRGESLFQSEYARLLDCSFERAIELAEDASRRGWIVLKRVGGIIEALFPNLLLPKEMEWIREQD